MGQEIGRAELHLGRVLLQHLRRQGPARDHPVPARVQLHRAHRRDHDRGVRHEARGAALDVEEALCSHVCAESRFGDEVVAGVDPDQVGHHGRVAVRDVAEGTGMDQDRRVLEGLQQVRLYGVAHDHRHGAGGTQLLGGHRLARRGVAHHDPPHPLAQVAQVPREGEHRHHLRGRGDVEPGLARDAILLGAKAAHDVAQGAVVDVEDALPGNAVGVDAQGVLIVEVVVHHGGQEVVGGGHCVKVPGEVEIEGLERDDLAVPAAGGATLDAEGRAHGGLADGNRRLQPDAGQRLAQAHRRGRLALAERCRGDRGDDDVAGTGSLVQRAHGVEAHLGDVRTVRFEQVRPDAHLRSNVGDWEQRGAPRDLDGRGERHRHGSCQTVPDPGRRRRQLANGPTLGPSRTGTGPREELRRAPPGGAPP